MSSEISARGWTMLLVSSFRLIWQEQAIPLDVESQKMNKQCQSYKKEFRHVFSARVTGLAGFQLILIHSISSFTLIIDPSGLVI
jgi:hypothetical protein